MRKEPMEEKMALQAGERLMAAVLGSYPTETNLRMEVTLVLPSREMQDLRLGLRIGEDRLYVVKNIPEMINAMDTETPISFGKGFDYRPEWMRFSEDDLRVLRHLRALTVSYAYGDTTLRGSELRLIYLPHLYAARILDELRTIPFRVMREDGTWFVNENIEDVYLPLRFMMEATPRGLTVTANLPESLTPVNREGGYVLMDGKISRVDPLQRDLLWILWDHRTEGTCVLDYPLKDTSAVAGEILPYLKTRGAVELSHDLEKRMVRVPLNASAYLDREGNGIRGEIHFRYGDTELNPFVPEKEKITLDKGEKLLLRDAEAEKNVLGILEDSGFRVRKGNVFLSGSNAIFGFVIEGLGKLQQCCEVFFSTEFKRIIPRRPVLTGSVRLRDTHLELMLRADGEPIPEVLALMEALSRKKNYFRLTDGRFLDLTDLGVWQETAETLYEAGLQDGNDLNRDYLTLRSYRACYLESILKDPALALEGTEELAGVTEPMTDDGASIPDPVLNTDLKPYQLHGYRWLRTMDRMHMGGILADDMGLGKTVQIIALLQSTSERGRTSLIVAPTSLTYNWYSEIRRFAPDLSAVVLNGTAEQREHVIRHICETGDVDVLITSYPLIRRDIELMADYRFRFAILDEAQHIKNAGSVAAAAVKRLDADTRFALTGTPMENGVGELWSIFDFVLPGYLPGYNAFMRRYQEGENGDDLRRRVQPFLLRRLKQDVLTELPEKMETVLTAAMTPEQEKVYQASMMRIRPRIESMIGNGALQKNRMEVLAAITELRQICCHPSLVLSGYNGISGKQELLAELLPSAVERGHRILLFSQFTGMLKILRKQMEDSGYTTMYLDGETPADERLKLTEEFNLGKTDIFLISLRAGGYGLNLTGANLVIHYDPWWNPATEEQATDRAYRIGQTKDVQVIRLVTGQSIEEQVVELGLRKKALFDRLITPGEASFEGMSEQDIRALFEMN